MKRVETRTQRRTPLAGRRVATAALLPLVIALSLVATGCGKSSDTNANEAYANGVCGALADWEQQVKSIASTFSGSISTPALKSAVAQVQSATQELTTKIKAVPAPDTSEGQAAKQQLDQLTTDVESTIDGAKTAVAKIPADASVVTVGATIAALAPQIQSLASDAKSAASSLKDAGGSLASAFKSTDSCQGLGGS